ncbi:MAG: zinc-ribbon domain containing protein [Chloroflexi bacterium]|nr:zinc-ribbon domain containing protein [Chloroflexota bacterium]
MQDKTLTCRDCGTEFTFTASEQEFFAQKGFTNEPGRCPSCRAARKANRGEGGGGGGFNARREMYPVTCAQCGKATEVPFQPRSDRPVYCSDCYAAHRPAGTGERRFGGGGERRYSGSGSGGGRSRSW